MGRKALAWIFYRKTSKISHDKTWTWIRMKTGKISFNRYTTQRGNRDATITHIKVDTAH